MAFARLVAMCKGFREMLNSYHYVQGFYGNMVPCVAMGKVFKDAMCKGRCKGFKEIVCSFCSSNRYA